MINAKEVLTEVKNQNEADRDQLLKEALNVIDWMWDVLHAVRTRNGLVEAIEEVRKKSRGAR